MSVFDGMTGVLDEAFGAPVTWTAAPAGPVTISGVFREEVLDEAIADGRPDTLAVPMLRVRKTVALLAKGHLVQPSAAPGRSFTVLRVIPASSPAADAFLLYILEEVTP